MEANRAPGWFHQERRNSQQGRLPRSVVAEQRHELSRLYFEGNAAQGRERTKSLFNILEGNS